jgi:peptidoglycan/xylan/chitin deacetylase (PgdA/CDA1 family)
MAGLRSSMNFLWSMAAMLSGGLIRMRGPRDDASVYLTFDDGPHPVHTTRLLDLLAKHGAKGTFFLIGRTAEQAPEVVRRILDEGHAIGNHSMTHPKMRKIGAAKQWAEIEQADNVLQRIDGVRRHAFRPPNGAVTLATVAASLWRRQSMVLWSIDSHDYKLGAADVIRRLHDNVPVGGDVILFHDDGGCAGEALETLLPLWRQAGLRFPALA